MRTRILAARILVDAQSELAPGAVIVEGARIVWVGPAEDAPDADETIDLGEAVLTPGLVNAHCHLDLSHLAGQVPYDGDFADWIRRIGMGRRAENAGEGVVEALRGAVARGTTSFGDFVTIRHFDEVVPAFEEVGARGRLFIEAIAFQPERADEKFEEIWDLMEMRALPERLQTGAAPHAPYTISRPLLERLVAVAEAHQRPLAIHVGESLEELAFLRHGIGPLREMLRSFAMDDPEFTPDGSLAEFFEHLNVSKAPLLLIHGNYVRPATVPGGAFVVYCPTAHDFFGHPEHPVKELLEEGVRVALGSDSAASGETVDLLSELQFLARERTDLSARAVFRMATEWGARALDLDTGAIHVGKLADFAAFTPDAGYSSLGDPEVKCVFTMVGGDVLHRL